MIQNNWPKILLVMFFPFALFSFNYADGMFNNQGQWICSGDIDIEKSYYESYTETFQNTINQIYLNDGGKAAQSYFEFAVKEETIGQDWKRSQVCLIRLGVDTTELSSIIIPTEKTQVPLDPNTRPKIDEINNSAPKEEIPPIEKFEPRQTNDSFYIGMVVIVVGAIVILATFFFKSRKKYSDSKTSSKDYEKNDEPKDEHYENVEIEINGGIEK